MRPLLVLAAFAALSSCGPYSSQTDLGGDVMQVPTGRPGEYYLIDTLRGVCLFHTVHQGRGELAQVDCANLPEARQYLHGASDLDRAGAPDPDQLSDQAWLKFRETYVSYSCQRIRDPRATPSLAEVLLQVGLDQADYEVMLDQASHDPDYWDDLSKETLSTCTAPAPQPLEPAPPSSPQP
jgi:hypothetical protein